MGIGSFRNAASKHRGSLRKGARVVIGLCLCGAIVSVAFGAEYDTPPQMAIATKAELTGSTYSDLGKWYDGLSKWVEYGSRDYTHYEDAVPSGQKGIPVVVYVDDPDHGQVLQANATVQGHNYQITWERLGGAVLAPTGGRSVGYAFVPIADLATGPATLTVTVKNFENAGDAAPITTLSDTVSFTVDRTPPVVAITAATNKVTVTSCNEIPARLHVQRQDRRGDWLPEETFLITGTPAVYEYDSLTHNGTNVQFWVSDMVGNETTKQSGSLGVSTNRVEYQGFSEENRSCYAVFVGTRLSDNANTLPEYFSFLL